MIDQQATIAISVSRNLRDAVATVMDVPESVVAPVVIAAANDKTAERDGVAWVVHESLLDPLLSSRTKPRDLPPQRFREATDGSGMRATPPIRSGRFLDKLGMTTELE
jgi:hypothetical protein